MCEALSLTVVRLKRIRLGSLDLGGLATGSYRYLTASEIATLNKGE